MRKVHRNKLNAVTKAWKDKNTPKLECHLNENKLNNKPPHSRELQS